MTDDRGLQGERTRLAWRRTTLATTVIALLAISRILDGGARPAVVALLITGAWAGVLLVARNRIRALRAVRPTPPAARSAPAALALLTAAIAVGGALLVH